jgi:hypothetical protein
MLSISVMYKVVNVNWLKKLLRGCKGINGRKCLKILSRFHSEIDLQAINSYSSLKKLKLEVKNINCGCALYWKDDPGLQFLDINLKRKIP